MRAFILIFLSFIFIYIPSNGQDAQFSQFYQAPLYLNPAFTGTALKSRAILNYRNQWPLAGKPFVSYAASFDHLFAKYNSGLGFMALQHTEGTSKLRSTEFSGLYSYFVEINENWTFIPGLQATFVQRNIDYSKIIFPDQLDNTGLVGATAENLNFNKKTYMDFSGGGLLFSEIFWFGLSYHHINRPNQSITVNQNHLPSEFNLHAGAKIPLASSAKGKTTQVHYKEKALVPAVLYKTQGKFDQLDLGIYMLYEPVMIGVWYRGLPVKKYDDGFSNTESIIGLVGFNYKGFTIGYSYDFIISTLTQRSAGAHELSLSYIFGKEQEHINKRKVRYKRIPCPGFYKHF